MEGKKKFPFLFVLLPLLQVSATTSHQCPAFPVNGLTCYNDFNHTINCVWNSTYVSDHTDSVCRIRTKNMKSRRRPYSSSCVLESADSSSPAVRKCSLVFNSSYIFLTSDQLSINLSCNPVQQNVSISYSPVCHVKVNPPGKPDVNFTTISWMSQITKHAMADLYKSHLQWKQHHQSWSDPAVQNKTGIQCEQECKAELDSDWLIQGEKYEARVRVQSIIGDYKGTWSDWSPTTAWVSPVGKPKPPSGVAVGFVYMIISGVCVFALVMAVVFFKTHKTTWVYIVKWIRGPPLPSPAKSFLRKTAVQSWLIPPFTSESYHSFLTSEEISAVEVTFTVDAVTPCWPDDKTSMNISCYDSTGSSFSNPDYSERCTPPPISSLTVGNLVPCAADTPFGPTSGHSEEKTEVQAIKDELWQLLFKSGGDSEQVQVISDYEKAEKIQAEQLQSPGSGVCNSEEVSKEIMEAHVTEGHDEGPEKEAENHKKADFLNLFGSSGGVSGKLIQVCSDYEQVQTVDSPELPSLDSGVGSGGEEQVSQEESMEEDDKSMCFQFPPHSSTVLSSTRFSSPQIPLNLSSQSLNLVLQPPPSQIVETTALMTSRSLEPSGDGYMPVTQEQS
ncbi:uncharacterized protein KZ484_024962 isoform 1-T2 [Pholidichthys leucotaenia]